MGDEYRRESWRMRTLFVTTRGLTSEEQLTKRGLDAKAAWKLAAFREIASSRVLNAFELGIITWREAWRIASDDPHDADAQDAALDDKTRHRNPG